MKVTKTKSEQPGPEYQAHIKLNFEFDLPLDSVDPTFEGNTDLDVVNFLADIGSQLIGSSDLQEQVMAYIWEYAGDLIYGGDPELEISIKRTSS